MAQHTDNTLTSIAAPAARLVKELNFFGWLLRLVGGGNGILGTQTRGCRFQSCEGGTA